MKTRGFEIVTDYVDKGIVLPTRRTGSSAGYDLAAAENVSLEPKRVTLVPTGLKAYMQPNEYLGIHVRSGFSVRNMVSCVNDEGIVDSDYYDNVGNEGHIFVALINHGARPVEIVKGTRIAQGIFYRYLTVDDDTAGIGNARSGGMGSTGND
ncbi:MAG: dUTP diphosphatase [Schwartzia sp.]|nr:dUTP diphosphatase [Schwartzia sp. (in: firmicutes)]